LQDPQKQFLPHLKGAFYQSFGRIQSSSLFFFIKIIIKQMLNKYKTPKEMEVLAKKIVKSLKNEKSVFLVSKTDEGKTYFAKNFLISYLKRIGIKAVYFENINKLKIVKNLELPVIDEVEILSDQKFLEKEHPKEKPYYPEKYLKSVKKWHNKLSKIKVSAIYLITRNNKKEINYLKKNTSKTEWNKSLIVVLEYKN